MKNVINTATAATLSLAALRTLNKHRAANAARKGSIILTIDDKVKAVVCNKYVAFATIDPSLLPAAILAAKRVEWTRC